MWGQVWGPGPPGAEQTKRRGRGQSQDNLEPELPEVTGARGELTIVPTLQ